MVNKIYITVTTTLFIALGFIISPSFVYADSSETFNNWLLEFKQEAIQKGITKNTIKLGLIDIKPIPRIIELDRKQPESTMSFKKYLSLIVNQRRVNIGQKLLNENLSLLKEVSTRFGVQPRFIVSLWGIETNYGKNTGGFSVISALVTLAYDGRRSKYFRKELIYALQIIDQGHITPGDMKGSWAGAMGQSQFMPSSFMKFAYDFNGDGSKDIWNDKGDVFASAANYLSGVGWRSDITWGREVSLPHNFDANLANIKITKKMSQWRTLGVRRVDGAELPLREINASIVIPGKTSGPSYLVYDNYRALLRWNRSYYFATAVGILSDKISINQ